MKRLVTILALLVVLCVGQSHAQYNKRYIAWASRNMLASDNYDEAINILNVLIRSDKESYEAYYLRGYAKLGLGDLLGALQDFSTAIEINPVYTEAYHYRGIAFAELGNYEDAVRDFTSAIELRPDMAGSYYSRGVTHMRNKEWVRSLVDFDMVLRFTDKDAQTYINRGIALCGMRDTLAAHEMFDKAIRTNREYPEAYNQKAILLMAEERWEEALEVFDKAIKYDSDYLSPIFNRAIVLCNLKRYEEAIEAFERVVEIDPYITSAYFNLAIIYAQQDNLHKALENYDLVLQHTPENVKGYFNRAGVLLNLGHYQGALNDYTKAIELYPDFANAYLQRGRVKEYLRDYEGAKSDKETGERKIAEYRAKLEEDPESLTIYADTSRRFSQLLSFESKIAERKMMEESGSNATMREMFRLLHSAEEVAHTSHHYYSPLLESGKNGKLVFSNRPTAMKEEEVRAINESYKEEAAKEESVEILLGWSVAQLSQKQYTSAITLLTRAIALDPENPMLYLNRGVARAEMIEFINSFSSATESISLDGEIERRNGSRRIFNYDEAIADLTRAAELAPDFAYIYFNRANLHAYAGNMPAAYEDYTRAIELAPYLADAYFNRGLVQIYMKDTQKGAIDLSKAGELGIKEAYELLKRYQNINNQ